MNEARINAARILAALTLGTAAFVPMTTPAAHAVSASTQSICDVLPLWPGCAVKPKA